jgi:hypothetical protein
MARPQKYAEPTVHVSVRLPQSLVEELQRHQGTLSEAIVRACQTQAKRGSRIPEIAKCPHKRVAQVTKGTACLDCGDFV